MCLKPDVLFGLGQFALHNKNAKGTNLGKGYKLKHHFFFVGIFLFLFSTQAFANPETVVFDPNKTTLWIATTFFFVAVLHTLFSARILALARRFQPDSIGHNLLHYLGEVEVVFGFWAFMFMAYVAVSQGMPQTVSYLKSVNFTEAAFVFVIMCMAATRPVIQFARDAIAFLAKILPFPSRFSYYVTALIVGPLFGSFITEPAAMTVVALLLKEKFYDKRMSEKFKYATLGLLFVNISIGGTLTHFAAPPVLMVASSWNWDTPFMLVHFGWKSALSIVLGTFLTAYYFRKELKQENTKEADRTHEKRVPFWMVVSHFFFIILCVMYHATIPFFLPLFLLFLGWCDVTSKFQNSLKIRESLLVGFFLGGLVVLGGLQGWWLRPLLESLSDIQLFFGATALTAVTDNAALTYLGTLVPNLSDASKYALVAGAVTGGGLTVIANAPNPAGYGILNDSFGDTGISSLKLFLAALPYTIIAILFFLFSI